VADEDGTGPPSRRIDRLVWELGRGRRRGVGSAVHQGGDLL